MIEEGKFVELLYKVIDKKTSDILSEVEFPLGYIQGVSEILSPEVTASLVGQSQGDIIELPVDVEQIYGKRDESLVFTDHIENVPEKYQKVGTTITMENDKGEPKDFIVIRVDDKSITLDGNNPICGREVVFRLEILTVREPTDEELEMGGPIEITPDIDLSRARTIN